MSVGEVGSGQANVPMIALKITCVGCVCCYHPCHVKAHIAVISHTALVRGCVFHTEREREETEEVFT